jgi:tetratricopeptide (TPR) repeat protein
MLKKKTKKILIFFLFILFPHISFAYDQLKEGEKFIKYGEYLKCRDYYKKFIEYPNLADLALLNTGKCEYYLNNYPEASLYLRRLLRDFKESPYINEGNLYLGLSYLKLGKYFDGEFYLKRTTPPFDKPASIGLGWIAYHKGDLKYVESVLNKLTANDFKKDPDAHLLKIKYLAKTGKLTEALKEFDSNLKLRERKFDIDRAEILIMAKKFNEAEKLLTKVINVEDKFLNKIKAKSMLFDIYIDQERAEEALKLGKELSTYIITDDLKIKLLFLYLKQKNYDDALKTLISIRDQQLKTKKIEETINILEKENPQKAVEFIVKLYPFLRADSSLLIYYGEILIKHGRLVDAKKILKKVLSGPRKAEAIIPYAKILVEEGKLKEAKNILESIKDKKPSALAIYAQILQKEGDERNALLYMRKSAKFLQDPNMLLTAGNLEYSVGDKRNALNLWMKSANLGNAEAALKVADFYYLSKKIKEASHYYKKAIEIGTLDNNSLMWAYYQFGKINKDKSYLEKVANSEGELSKVAKELLDRL